ncbi:MAG: DUF434 domain-containing protein [Deltaproteobacteria bacterium]|nr:DUF434 domain-containing protein [Deltaproteobacteria bacterium]
MTRIPPLPDPAILRQAAGDFRFLLDRGYPRQAGLVLVGNRYGLDRSARQMLHRGVFAADKARERRAKLRLLTEAGGEPLAVDGHNVLITLECAFRGLPVIVGDDGFIRDVAQISRAFRVNRDTERVLELLAYYLKEHHVSRVTVLYDAPMSKSGDLARRTREVFEEVGLAGEARAVPVPEQELLTFPGLVATSDTHLIDAREIIVDVAGEIIRRERAQGNFIQIIELA